MYVCSLHVCVCVYYAYVCVLCIYVRVFVLSVCLCLRSVVACVCHSTQHLAARCTLVNVMLLHTHTHISMQTCCGFCVRVCVCASVADMKYLFAALLAFCFFDIRFFLSLLLSFSHSLATFTPLSLYPFLSPLSTRGTYNFVMKFAAHGQQFMCCCNYSLGLRRSSPGQ